MGFEKIQGGSLIRHVIVDAPEGFDDLVRTPGLEFLAQFPNPVATQWTNHDYWNLVKADLRAAFKGLCGYSAFKVHLSGEVDHYIAKAVDPLLAYNWTNFRYSSGEMNQKKWERGPNRILDPFEIEDGWFTIEIPSYKIKWTDAVPVNQRDRAQDTIDLLGLNDEIFKQTRSEYGKRLIDNPGNKALFELVEENCPMVARAVLEYLTANHNV